MDRRGFFKSTVGAVVSATVAGTITHGDEKFHATELKLKGSPHDRGSYFLYKAMEFAEVHPNSRAVVMFRNRQALRYAVDSINFPHGGTSIKLTYTVTTGELRFNNGSVVKLETADEPMKLMSYEFNAAWVHDVDDIVARNIALSRVRMEPHIREWSEFNRM